MKGQSFVKEQDPEKLDGDILIDMLENLLSLDDFESFGHCLKAMQRPLTYEANICLP